MMTVILILLGLILLAALFGIFATKHGEEKEPVHMPTHSCATCNGIDQMCEQVCMMEAATKDIEYFDDEELDRFQGKPSDQYTDEEAGEFAEVLYTMRQEEVKDWNRSLALRGIHLPDQLKDEFIMLISNQ